MTEQEGFALRPDKSVSNPRGCRSGSLRFLTEQEGFEPPVPYGTMVFKTIALNHSATAPEN